MPSTDEKEAASFRALLLQPMTEKPPIHQRAWPVYTGLVLSALSLLVAITGPATKDWLPVFRGIGGLLVQYGFYIGGALLLGVVYSRRVFLGRVLAKIYVATLRFVLKPVLAPRKGWAPQKIHYGDRVTVRHFTTGKFLTSCEGMHYNLLGGGSGQQIVFGASIADDSSVWAIRPPHGQDPFSLHGQEVKEGHPIRIWHEATDGYLHSHGNLSPFSIANNDVQREVSVYEENNVQDNWRVSTVREGELVTKWRFKHSDGAVALHSHDRPQPLPSPFRSTCYEVTTCPNPNDDDFWVIEQIGPLPEDD